MKLRFAAALISAVVWAGSVAADNLALVISNSPKRAEWFSRGADGYLTTLNRLSRAGFSVTTVELASQAEIAEALTVFAKAITPEDRVLVLLDGTMANVSGQNWLLSGGAGAADAFTLGARAIPVAPVAELLSIAPGRSVLALSAQPVEGRLGNGVRPGLSDYAPPQGVTLFHGAPTDVFRLVGGDLLDPRRSVGAAAARASDVVASGFLPRGQSFMQDTTPTAPKMTSALFYEAAQAIGTPEAFTAYLDRYPNGAEAEAARAARSALERSKAEDAEATEAALNLSRDARRAIQTDLRALGHYNSAIDGLYGRGTRAAIAGWQESAGFPPTGYVTAAQIAVLQTQAAPILQAEAEERAKQQKADRDYWAQTGAKGTPAGFATYLERYPNGEFADIARSQLEEAQSERIAPATNDRWTQQIERAKAAEANVAKSGVARLLIEQRLASLGYEIGFVDGRFDNAARSAIQAYQQDKGIPATGYVDNATAASLLVSR
ncbi:hypothetical protein ACMU_03285 [Actibacterium mucosum KCTC 23349]|uniref:Peptidoglycan binding-like domain-containing protein n=1 Tax=Actibacterium mucosum KCTC 23349 TaxID=1454373 RepID=A0A037ZN83_9RHOB|nr:peptidoglycan-binding domain-containing protein [Actibacterium mucosum]KAJ57544.1 hypothetical protein ACMU_03285 [Actibacterium mucosum KCTC 23349]